MTGNNLFFYDFYLLRIPTFSFNKLTKINAVLGNIKQERDLNEDNISELKNIFSDETFLEALFFASPVLFEEVKKWLAGSNYSNEELIKLLLALHRYYIRMCSRCTPFGTFAGATTGSITEESTEIQFKTNKLRKMVDFDMGFIGSCLKTVWNKFYIVIGFGCFGQSLNCLYLFRRLKPTAINCLKQFLKQI